MVELVPQPSVFDKVATYRIKKDSVALLAQAYYVVLWFPASFQASLVVCVYAELTSNQEGFRRTCTPISETICKNVKTYIRLPGTKKHTAKVVNCRQWINWPTNEN